MGRMWKALGVIAAVVVLLVGGAPAVGYAAGVPEKPTFTKDIAPIFQEKCEACHRTDSIAPMSLVTYEESRPVGALDQGARRAASDA